MTWVAADVGDRDAAGLADVMALRPDLAELLEHYSSEAWAGNDPVVLELCRLRIAMLHRDPDQQRVRHRPALEAGLTEEKIAAIPHYPSSALFSEHERACLAYAEQFVIDVHGITDADAERVKRTMTDAEFVSFTVALGLLDGIGRMRLILDVHETP
jgi:alkylhydroperoxidase family enzyme